MFGAYLSPEAVEKMLAEDSAPSDVEMTPFYASIHGYVGLCEQVPLKLLSELMSAYFEACTTEIQQEGGMIGKFVGDAIAAMFGAPVRTPDHAARACVAALKCQARMAELRQRWSHDGTRWPEPARQLRIRIGLHSGMVMVGNIGTKERFSYTMMGDNVNLAAGMESSAKNWGVWTLCTAATRNACEMTSSGRILFRSLGSIVVKGRAAPLGLFEPVALRENVTDQERECVSLFEQGLARWRERDWAGAIALFEQSARVEPNQVDPRADITANPSMVYLALARECRDKPDADRLNSLLPR